MRSGIEKPKIVDCSPISIMMAGTFLRSDTAKDNKATRDFCHSMTIQGRWVVQGGFFFVTLRLGF